MYMQQRDQTLRLRSPQRGGHLQQEISTVEN